MSEKKKRKAHRRRDFVVEKILRHALEELTVRGAAGFRVENVAKAADVNKTTIYRRWPTKEGLIKAALGSGMPGEGENPPAKSRGEGGGIKLEFLALSAEYRAWMVSPVGKSFLQLQAGPPPAPALRQMIKGWKSARRAPLERFARTSGLKAGLPREAFVDAWEGALLKRRPEKENAKATGALADLLLRAVTCRE
jgi:AcrR family transcriptional regulator